LRLLGAFEAVELVSVKGVLNHACDVLPEVLGQSDNPIVFGIRLACLKLGVARRWQAAYLGLPRLVNFVMNRGQLVEGEEG